MTCNRIDRRTVLVALAGLLTATRFPRADQIDGGEGQGDDDDHDRARRALREGQVLPLSGILAMVRDRLGGEVIEVELEHEDGRYVYEIKVLQATGRLREVSVDAASGAILKVEDD